MPGAYHMIRWTAQFIYCMKIYLLRNEFKLTMKEQNNLCEFCIVAAHIYVPAWIACPIASDAPASDLMLFTRIKQYSEINKVISNAAMKSFKITLGTLGQK